MRYKCPLDALPDQRLAANPPCPVVDGEPKYAGVTYRGGQNLRVSALDSRAWAAQLNFRGMLLYLGSYETAMEAAQVYDNLAYYLGVVMGYKFARLNFPKSYLDSNTEALPQTEATTAFIQKVRERFPHVSPRVQVDTPVEDVTHLLRDYGAGLDNIARAYKALMAEVVQARHARDEAERKAQQAEDFAMRIGTRNSEEVQKLRAENEALKTAPPVIPQEFLDRLAFAEHRAATLLAGSTPPTPEA